MVECEKAMQLFDAYLRIAGQYVKVVSGLSAKVGLHDEFGWHEAEAANLCDEVLDARKELEYHCREHGCRYMGLSKVASP